MFDLHIANLSHSLDTTLTEGVPTRDDEGAMTPGVAVSLRAERARDEHHADTFLRALHC